MKIAFAPSLNGLGHLRRLISIANPLRELGFEITFVLSNQYILSAKFISILKDQKIDFLSVPTPKYVDGPFTQRSDKSEDIYLTSKNLGAYDFIIADTVTWPLGIHDKVIFIGQFTWDLYYRHALIGKDKEKSQEQNLEKNALVVFGMIDFTWPEIAKLHNYQPIPLLDYWKLRNLTVDREKKLGIISSGIEESGILDVRRKMDLIEVSAPESYYSRYGSYPVGILCRAGLGAISENLSIKSVPILFPSDDFELSRNVDILLGKGWGILLDHEQASNPSALIERSVELARSIEFPSTISSSDLAGIILKSGVL